MSNNRIDISIIIPCFNEAEGIAHLVTKLKELEERFTESHELIFIDDGSSDSTYEKLTHFYQHRRGTDVKIVRHFKNRGLGIAIKTGILNSQGHYLAIIDSDCTYEPIYLLKMFEIIKKEKADIITTSPFHPEGSTCDVSGHRIFLSRSLSKLYSVILRHKLYTYTSMFRIYRTEAIKGMDFEANGFLAMAEILIKAQRKGFKIIEYPATLTRRTYGNSNAEILKLIKGHLRLIIKILLKKENG
ncbi:MAG: glycosyltransferase family 2 protein [Omnitrophica bacterium]|nr:glycosyltransferase family 2 protein [Candidatus Omnitrophota bacterium]